MDNKKRLKNLALFKLIFKPYLAGGTYKIPPFVHNSFGPLSGKIPVQQYFFYSFHHITNLLNNS